MSETMLRAELFNALPMAAMTVDAALRVMDWNDAMESLTGLGRDEVVGRKCQTVFGGVRATPVHHSCLMGEPHQEVVSWQNVRTGQCQDLLWKVEPLCEPDGTLRGASVVVEPPSDLGAEAKLQALDRVVAVIEFEPDGTILSANANFLKVMGYSADQLAGAHHRIFMDPQESARPSYALFWEQLRSGQMTQGRFERCRRDGQRVWLDASYNPVVGDDGQVIKVIKFATDITEQVELEAQSREQMAEMARVRSIVDNSPNALMICDIEDDYKIVYANASTIETLRGLEQHLPVSADNLVGQSIDIFHKVPQRQRRFLKDPANLPLRSQVSIGDEYLDLQVYALYNDKGEYTGPALAWEVVTERVRMAQREEQARHAIERVQVALDEVAKGNIDVFIEADYEGSLEKMKDNVNRIVGVLRDFRDEFARLTEANKRGELGARANAERFEGDLAEIMENANSMLDVIQSPMERFQHHLAQMARGDLTATIVEDYQGDHARLRDAFNASLQGLNEILLGVQEGVERISTASTEISTASLQVSEGASAQAAAIEEISAQMAEITSKTRQNAEYAAQANELVANVRQSAGEGDVQMASMVSSMHEISEASQNISSIIKVIDEIAFQTNLLALNAAVEAARAGVHGKGFAVVAEEVRNLAARSARAARETTELIKGSAKKVTEGMQTANKTAEALGAIVSSVTRVTELVAMISSASDEQAQGIEQINIGLEQINEVTQANTAGAEQSAAAAQQLTALVGRLKEMLGSFELQEPQVAEGLPSWLTPQMLEALKAVVGSSADFPPAAVTMLEQGSLDAQGPSFFNGHGFGKY